MMIQEDINNSLHEEHARRKKRKRRKKYNEYNAVLNDVDHETFVALYRHRLLTVEMLYQLIIEDKRELLLASYRNRLNKLAVKGYLEGRSVSKVVIGKTENLNVPEKAYSLTDKGILVVLDYLDLYDYSFDQEGAFNIEFDKAEDIKVHGQLPHHFMTQGIVINTLRAFETKYEGTRFYEFNCGNGKKYSLKWNSNEKERSIYPDWMFVFSEEESVSQNDSIYIAVEADRKTMNGKQIEQKFIGYLNHVQQNEKLYINTPLTVVVAVENRSRKRIKTLIQNVFLTMESAIYENLVRVYVVSEEEAGEKIIHSLREGVTFDENIEDAIKGMAETVTRSTGYMLKHTLLGYESQDKHGFLPTPSREMVFGKGYGEEIRFICLEMEKGSVNSQAKAFHFKETLQQSDKKAYVLGMYNKKEDLIDEMFIDTSRRYNQTVQMGKQVIFSTSIDLKKGIVYQIEKNQNNTQIIRQVSLQDVLV
ncbi:replication-relaxation family protein [Brevibacillus sp. NPDC003359]|uniref:replication-relaxation family protein n=1 Tax=unclassified Brevibacillus TaxID=2684853 RepID=UPI0036872421